MLIAAGKQAAFYVTLDAASGNGSVTFVAQKASVITKVTKVTVEMTNTSSGRVQLSRVGQYLTDMPVAPKMEAIGDEPLHTSEYLTLAVDNGPRGEVVKVTFFYDEETDTP